MRETDIVRTPQRGVVMLIVVILVALLIIVALIVAYGAFNAQTSAQALGVKYRVLNSAEAGANMALNELAEDPNYPSGNCVSGTLNAKPYSGCVELNQLNKGSGSAIDPETGAQITVPANSAYIYGESSFQGSRKVYIEAIADPSPPLTLPGGAINAQNDVNDTSPEPISQDPIQPGDANVNADGNINVTGTPSTVQGTTTAVGTNQLPGGTSGGASVAFPSQVEVQQTAQNAKSIAQAGTQVSGSSLSSGSGGALNGNVYVNGDIQLSKGTIMITQGSYVYVNGNVCVSGSGVIANANQGQNILVVSGVMAVTGSGNFNTAPGQNSLLLVLGSDPTTFNPCGGGPYALDLEPTGMPSQIGTVYAASGSAYLGGSTTLTGAADAGSNVLIGGGPSSAFKYDSVQSATTMTTGTLTYSAYNEY
jgi:hypothetical protein